MFNLFQRAFCYLDILNQNIDSNMTVQILEIVPAITIQITNKHGRKSMGRDSLTLSDSSKTHYFNNEHSPTMAGTRLSFYANRFISS